jgi:HSP20 family protein
MSTLHQLREGLSEAWDTLLEGWQRLYRRAAGAITRFTPAGKDREEASAQEGQEIAARSTGWGVLAAEVFDDADKVVVRLEAPGMAKGDFELQLRDEYLVVSGEKQLHRERSEGRYHVTECAYGRFERAVPLPDEVETEAAKATYEHGVLRVELPKSVKRRRRSIKVDVK